LNPFGKKKRKRKTKENRRRPKAKGVYEPNTSHQ